MTKSTLGKHPTTWGTLVVGLVGLVFTLMPAHAKGGAILTLNQINIEQFPQIRIYLTASDERGTPFKGLGSSNFGVQEDGKTVRVQEVYPLERGEEPLSVVLAIDRSGSMSGQPIRDARQAAVNFIEEIRGIDRVGVVSFDDYVAVISRPNSDKGPLLKAITKINVGKDTALNDAIMKSLALLSPFTGRRAVVVLTDGKENKSKASRKEAINKAKGIGVPVITVGLGEEVDASALEAIAGGTGGHPFFAQESSELPNLYRAIARQLINQYRLTLKSRKSLDGGWHQLRVQLTTAQGKAEVERLYLATLKQTMGAGVMKAYRKKADLYYVIAIILGVLAIGLCVAIIVVAVGRSNKTKGTRKSG